MNEGIHRVSIVCKERGCPEVVKTRNVDAKGKLRHIPNLPRCCPHAQLK